MSGKYVVVIDKGTTNLKAVLFDLDGNEAAAVTKPCGEPLSLKPGWCEQDMDYIWDMTGCAISELCGTLSDPSEIMGVSVTGHGSGIFPIDKNGNPVRKGILSLDTRAAGIVEEWKADKRAEWFQEKMNAEVLPCYPVSLLAWMKTNEPGQYNNIDKILFVKDWIKYRLTGAATTDYTDAGPSCLLDVETMDYCTETFDKMEIPEMKQALPDIVPSYQTAGFVTEEAAAKTGLYEGTPVFSGVHDMMACPFGVGTVDKSQVICVVGTWGMNFMSSKERQGTFSFPHVIPGYFLTGRLDGNSGSVQDRMIRLLCPPEMVEKEEKNVYQYAQERAGNSKGSTLIFQPYLFGSLYDPAACGGFYGLRDWHTRDDMIAAVYEGIVFGHYANIRTIGGYEEFTTLWLMGGGARSSYLAQMFADVTGLRVKTARADDVTARGAALSTLVGLGICRSYEEACIPVQVKDEFEPDIKKMQYYRDKFSIYENITRSMEGVWKDMEKLEKERV